MSSMFLIMVGVLILSIVAFGFVGYEATLNRKLRSRGITMTRCEAKLMGSGTPFSPRKHARIFRFDGVVDETGQAVSGVAQINSAFGGAGSQILFDRGKEPLPAIAVEMRNAEREEQALASPADPAVEREAEIRAEVARRLDAIQSSKEAFLTHDLDGDGMVDADEWARAREQVEDEVRAELGEGPPAQTRETPETPENDAVPDTPAPPQDGHW